MAWKLSVTCFETYFAKSTLRMAKLRSTLFGVPNNQFSQIFVVLEPKFIMFHFNRSELHLCFTATLSFKLVY